MLTWSNYCVLVSKCSFFFVETTRLGCIDSNSFLGCFCLCCVFPSGNSIEAVAKSLTKQRWWWSVYYYPGSSYCPCVNLGDLSCLLIGSLPVIKTFLICFSLSFTITFPISITSYTDYSLLSYTKLHIKYITVSNVYYYLFCKEKKETHLRSNVWKIASEIWGDILMDHQPQLHSGTYPEARRGFCFPFRWGMRSAALHHGNARLSPCSGSGEGWCCWSGTNYLSIRVWGWVFQAQCSEVAVALCQHQLLQQCLALLRGQSLPHLHTSQSNHLSFCS